MKTAFSIGIVAFLAACAGATPRPQNESDPEGRWQGYFSHNGLRQPMALELSQASSAWDGRFATGDNAVSLESVRVSGRSVHFEVPAEAATFDGAVDGNKMEGSVSGPVSGSFNLTRSDSWTPYPFGP
ncbi:MAG TPA: hypothetical protein VE964_16920 [Myxococcales bacterium]|nr:hypothetical protein [Myxococcales bacterium]